MDEQQKNMLLMVANTNFCDNSIYNELRKMMYNNPGRWGGRTKLGRVLREKKFKTLTAFNNDWVVNWPKTFELFGIKSEEITESIDVYRDAISVRNCKKYGLDNSEKELDFVAVLDALIESNKGTVDTVNKLAKKCYGVNTHIS